MTDKYSKHLGLSCHKYVDIATQTSAPGDDEPNVYESCESDSNRTDYRCSIKSSHGRLSRHHYSSCLKPWSKSCPPQNDRKRSYEACPYQRKKRYSDACLHQNPVAYEHLLRFPLKTEFIDAHCHIDFLFRKLSYVKNYATFRKENRSSFPENYGGCITVFCNPHSFDKREEWEMILQEPKVWAAFGCHPHQVMKFDEKSMDALKVALSHPSVVALGEIGLDYSHKNTSEIAIQHEVFKAQIGVAIEKRLPLVIHSREAFADTMKIMTEMVPKNHKIHLHCFTGPWSEAEAWIKAFPNLCIGLTAVVTFASAVCTHDVARRIPLDRLLLETDAPYFVPRESTLRAPASHPGMALHVAAQISALKEYPLELVLMAARSNTKKIYSI